MSPNALSTYRVYASGYNSIKNLQSVKLKNGIHVALAFARDYDEDGNPTEGDFKIYFKKGELSPTRINTFKQQSASDVKFFLSIGGRDEKYPFSVTPSNKETWISNATTSLKKIIEQYNLDGLDVYYEHINPAGQGQFKDAIGQVIRNLKNEVAGGFLVSITVSAPVSDAYYSPLYQAHDKFIDAVVYQTHTCSTVIETSQSLIKDVLGKLPYAKKKLIAGHSSTQPLDWTTVPVPIFLGAVPHLLDQNPATASGISYWTVTGDDNPEKTEKP